MEYEYAQYPGMEVNINSNFMWNKKKNTLPDIQK